MDLISGSLDISVSMVNRWYNAETQRRGRREADTFAGVPCYVPTNRTQNHITAATMSKTPDPARLSASKLWRQPENQAFEFPFIEESLKR